jgi:hypothetical protein
MFNRQLIQNQALEFAETFKQDLKQRQQEEALKAKKKTAVLQTLRDSKPKVHGNDILTSFSSILEDSLTGPKVSSNNFVGRRGLSIQEHIKRAQNDMVDDQEYENVFKNVLDTPFVRDLDSPILQPNLYIDPSISSISTDVLAVYKSGGFAAEMVFKKCIQSFSLSLFVEPIE